MALPPRIIDGNQPETYGIGIRMTPGDPPTYGVELQRAPDDGLGGPGTFAPLTQLPPLSGELVYVDLLPPDNAFRHYRWRHIGPGYDPSPLWSAVGRGRPVRLEGNAAAGGLISIYPIIRSRPMSDGKFALKASDAVGKETDDDLFISSTKTVKVGTVASPASLTRTIRFDHSQFAPEADFTQWFNDTLQIQPRSNNTEVLYAPVVLPKGVTITKLRGRIFLSDTFPTVLSLTETSFSTDTLTHNVSMPATVLAGELLLMLFTSDGTLGHTTPSGWTLIKTLAGTQTRVSVYGKVAIGDEDGTTVNVATVATETAAAQVYRITDWWGSLSGIEASTGAAASGTTPDPDNLAPSWGTARPLWIAVCSADNAPTVSAYPTNYTNGTRTASGGTDQCMLASARREIRGSSENPGTFTIGTSGAWAAFTIAVRPSATASEDVVTLQLNRSTTDVSTLIASVAGDAVGWDTNEASLSQLVGDETYTLKLTMQANDLFTDAALQFAEIEYTRPDYSQVY